MPQSLTMYRCPRCARIKRFSDWVFMSQMSDTEKANFTFLISQDKIEWVHIVCRHCVDDAMEGINPS